MADCGWTLRGVWQCTAVALVWRIQVLRSFRRSLFNAVAINWLKHVLHREVQKLRMRDAASFIMNPDFYNTKKAWGETAVGLVSPDLWQAYVWPYGALAVCGRQRCHCTEDRGSSHRFSHVGTWCAPLGRSAACSPGHSRGRSTVGQRHLASSVPDLGKIERSEQSEGGGIEERKKNSICGKNSCHLRLWENDR